MYYLPGMYSNIRTNIGLKKLIRILTIPAKCAYLDGRYGFLRWGARGWILLSFSSFYRVPVTECDKAHFRNRGAYI